jgi:hypothetical protein
MGIMMASKRPSADEVLEGLKMWLMSESVRLRDLLDLSEHYKWKMAQVRETMLKIGELSSYPIPEPMPEKREMTPLPIEVKGGVAKFEQVVSAGVCPVCGKEGMLGYGDMKRDCDLAYYPFVCGVCGSQGKEWFTMVFDQSVVSIDSEGRQG